MLLRERHDSFDAQGRLTRRETLRYRFENQWAVEHYGAIETRWSPWYQERPELSLTVVLPDGSRHVLDPKTIEISDVAGEGNMFVSQKRLRVPVPKLVVGATVEREEVLREHQPYFSASRSDIFTFEGTIPTQRTRLVVEAPSIHWAPVGGLALKPKSDEIKQGRHRLVFEAVDLPVVTQAERGVPAPLLSSRAIAYSTTDNWEKLGNDYAGHVAQQIKDSPLSIPKSKLRTRTEIIESLLKQVHEKVRYTGLEFGRSAIIPVPPHVALERGYGDCKDKATLLVALLRRQNIEAHVALIHSRGREPVRRAPGLEHFDHAIVYVPGPDAMWIDATMVGQPAHEVPIVHAGHVALVTRDQGSSLVQIPEAKSADHVNNQVIRIKMADFGPGEVTENWQATGWQRVSLRSRLTKNTDDQWLKALKDYVTKEYGQDKVEGLRILRGSVGDQTSPSLSFKAAAPSRVGTEGVNAGVRLNLQPLFNWLPSHLIRAGKEEGTRRLPLEISRPHVAELEFLIDMPTGFVPKDLLESATESLGGATLSRSISTTGSTARLFYRLDTGPKVWTPQQVDAFRKFIATFSTEVSLVFEHEGEKLGLQKKHAESLKVFQKIAKQYPKQGVQQARLASALSDLGLQPQAIRAAKRAIKISPDHMYPHFMHGVLLFSDPFGRFQSQVTDRNGAVRAFRRAKDLDPQNAMARQNLAVLLETNVAGVRYGQGAEMEDALQEYLNYEKDLGAKNLRVNAMVVLLRLGRFGEVLGMAKDTPNARGRNGVAAAAALASGDADQAVKTLRELGSTPQEISTALQMAITLFTAFGRFDLMADAMEAAANGSPDEVMVRSNAAQIRGTKRSEDVISKAKGPLKVALRSIELISYDPLGAESSEVLSKAAQQEFKREDEATKGAFTEAARRKAHEEKRATDNNISAMLDLMISNLKESTEGDDKLGYRVTLTNGLAKDDPITVFVIKEAGKYRVRATQEGVAALGAEALSRLKAGDLKAAQQWLDWAAMLRTQAVFRKFWGEGKPRTKQQTTLAAAVLASSQKGTSAPALAALKTVEWPDDPKLQYALLLCQSEASYAQRGESFRLAKKAYELEPLRKRALWKMGAEAVSDEERRVTETALRAALAQQPRDVHFRRFLGSNLAASNRIVEAQKELTTAIEQATKKVPQYYADRAWNALFTEDKNTMKQDALRGASGFDFKGLASLHTLATVYAMNDEPNEAMGVLQRIYDLRAWEFESIDYLILGRIYESYGFKQDALQAYAKVLAKPDPSVIASQRLAEQRIRLLRSKAKR